jgi:hypothetical protein
MRIRTSDLRFIRRGPHSRLYLHLLYKHINQWPSTHINLELNSLVKYEKIESNMEK